ncbi:MAG: hypothetical protein J5654_02915 [Victivallales bacterium]|nr:hypothetical protein [Victivallales bacterium]
MLPLLDIIVSSPPPEPSASWGEAWRLLVALPVGFLFLLGVFWAGVALVGYIKRHASRMKSNLSASVPKLPEDDGKPDKEKP